jgi:hypothetical protein
MIQSILKRYLQQSSSEEGKVECHRIPHAYLSRILEDNPRISKQDFLEIAD